jgi:hypothetical protein
MKFMERVVSASGPLAFNCDVSSDIGNISQRQVAMSKGEHGGLDTDSDLEQLGRFDSLVAKVQGDSAGHDRCARLCHDEASSRSLPHFRDGLMLQDADRFAQHGPTDAICVKKILLRADDVSDAPTPADYVRLDFGGDALCHLGRSRRFDPERLRGPGTQPFRRFTLVNFSIAWHLCFLKLRGNSRPGEAIG